MNRELDALVAEKVMGWSWCHWRNSGGDNVLVQIPRFSSDWNAAMQVVAKMKGPPCDANRWCNFCRELPVFTTTYLTGHDPRRHLPRCPRSPWSGGARLMCFYNDDYDWTAEFQIERGEIAYRPRRCSECAADIQPGEWLLYVWQQQYDFCQVCDEFGEHYGGDFPQHPDTCAHDFGEEYEYVACINCAKLRYVIWEQERAEGCPEEERHPAYGLIRDEAFASPTYNTNIPKYRAKAAELYPDWDHVYMR